MNSSLLVPATVVIGLAAMGAVFFGDVFSSGAGSSQSDYAVSKTEMNRPSKTSSETEAAKATQEMASEFSWDDEDSFDEDRDLLDNVASDLESFVSAKQSDEAPGDVFSPSEGTTDPLDVSKGSDIAATDLASNSTEDLNTSKEIKAVSKQVDNDLDSFFNLPKESKSNSDVGKRSTLPKTTTKAKTSEFVSDSGVTDTQMKSKASKTESLGMQLAAAEPKKEELSIDAFASESASHHHNETVHNDFVKEPAGSNTKPNEDLQSVVSVEPSDKDLNSTTSLMQADADANDVITGDLEPVEKVVRKFKITNPKETTLPVTMSVDGKQVTLKPDQTYVISDHNGAVNVTFSRGGSFGFENKTLNNGHYRFSVTREAGWKLSN